MATIYEGTQREQDLVDERIDPEILRALGLEDVVDLDYDQYKTLLKERLATSRLQQQYETDNQKRIDQLWMRRSLKNSKEYKERLVDLKSRMKSKFSEDVTCTILWWRWIGSKNITFQQQLARKKRKVPSG